MPKESIMLHAQLNLTAAIVRTYGFPGIGQFVEKFLDFGIRHVVVVVPKDQDKGVTAPLLRPFNPSRVHLVEQSFQHGGHAWSAMLNAGLDYIKENAILHEFVLMASNTVLLGAHHLERLYAEMDFTEVMVAGAKFKGIGKNGEEVSLGAAYNHHYRNTLALYRAHAFQLGQVGRALRRFDESFDGAGGMEDLAWKLMLEGLTKYRVAEVPLVVPLAVHQHRTPTQQWEYEATMERGIQAVKTAWLGRGWR